MIRKPDDPLRLAPRPRRARLRKSAWIAAFLLVLVGVIAVWEQARLDLGSFSTLRQRVESTGWKPQPVTPEERDHVLTLVTNLAACSTPDYGLSATLSGRAFAPLPEVEPEMGVMIFAHHGLRTCPQLSRLVAEGPKALPELLRELTNRTSTQLEIQIPWGPMGRLDFRDELAGVSAATLEQNRSRPRKALQETLPDAGSYDVTVGDVCFVALGQIVGRGYEAVRYQPSMLVVVNSPARDSLLCETVRTLWPVSNPAQTLMDSLLKDYAQPVGWGRGQAAMRLLYYFPDATGDIVAEG
jgi:hypothetical protein